MRIPFLNRVLICQSGNVTLIAALAAVPVIGSAGVAIDYARAGKFATEVRSALDSAVLAGAAAPAKNASVAENYFKANFPVPGVKLVSVNFTASGNTRVRGSARIEVETSFASILGIKTMNLDVSAAAETTAAKTDVCILVLSPNEPQALLANSGADVNANSCEIHVKSTANPAAISNAGTSIKTHRACLEGSRIINNGGTLTNLELDCDTESDTYAGTIPAPASASCDFSNMNYSGNVTLNPGVYCGWINFNSKTDVTLNPGTYVIKNGGWNVNGGDWSGDGVTFYFADTSKIQFNSAVKATLKAPKSGAYENILFAEPQGLSPSQFVVDDNLGFNMTGVIYLPSREVVFNSGSKTNNQKMRAVIRKVIFNSTHWNITPPGGPGGSAAAQVRLTE